MLSHLYAKESREMEVFLIIFFSLHFMKPNLMKISQGLKRDFSGYWLT